MIKNLIVGSLITANGKSSYSGFYDENGKPVKLMLEKDNDDVILAVFAVGCDKNQPCDCGISDEEIDRVCMEQEDCDKCPLRECCKWEEEDDE